MNEKCSNRYTFQINRIPTGIPDLIFRRIRVPPAVTSLPAQLVDEFLPRLSGITAVGIRRVV
jgi:hypothetical protein